VSRVLRREYVSKGWWKGTVFRFRVFFFFPAQLQQTKPSEAAQLKLIACGKAQPAARSRGGLKRLLEAEHELVEEENDVVLHDDDDEVQERFEFVDDDDDGDLGTPKRTVAVDDRETPPTRKKKVFKTGSHPKNKDLRIEDSHGKMLCSMRRDGTVKINLGKLILRPVTKEEIAQKRYFDGRGKLIDEDCWRCLLPRFQPESHNEFVRVGEHTGNLGKHCKEYHLPVLEGLQRVIAETPKEEAKFACQNYIKELGPPQGVRTIGRMFGLGEEDTSPMSCCVSFGFWTRTLLFPSLTIRCFVS
jgi:hypothetical protein